MSFVSKRVSAAIVGLAVLASCSQQASPDSAATATQIVAAQEPAVPAVPKQLRLLSQEQYLNTITSIFGADVLPNVTFAPFQRTEGLLAAGAGDAGVTEDRVELYQRAASAVAANVVAPERRDFLMPCRPANEKAADKACATKFLSYVGQRLNRRPLPPQRLAEIVDYAGSGADRLGDFYAGLAVALEGLLASPSTLYIEETTEPDPKNRAGERLDAYALASRLSFFLTNQAPNDALLIAAAKGELHTAKGRAKAVDALLASSDFELGLRAFFDDMLRFDTFPTLAKDTAIYPRFTGASAIAAREQTLRLLVDHLITNKGDYRDLFTTRVTFISKALAPLYGLPMEASWTRYELPQGDPHVGLLTQVSFLALHSHAGRGSPTLRGKALREILLCQPVPAPPANVDFSLVNNPKSSYPTQRDRVNAHLENPVCAGCHKITDPMGLALENFDGSGRYRTTENGNPIDASGILDGAKFENVAGLAEAVRNHPAVPSCVVKRAYSYGVGTQLRREDQPLVNYFTERFAAEGYRMPALMRMIALSEAFAAIGAEQGPAPAPEKSANLSLVQPTFSGTR